LRKERWRKGATIQRTEGSCNSLRLKKQHREGGRGREKGGEKGGKRVVAGGSGVTTLGANFEKTQDTKRKNLKSGQMGKMCLGKMQG